MSGISPKFRELLRFGIVGVLATAIHYGCYYLLLFFCSINIAYTIGYVVSFCFNLLLNAKYTFHSTLTFKKVIGFSLSHLINYLLQIIVLNVTVFWGVDKRLAPICVYAICIPLNFILVRYVFKK